MKIREYTGLWAAQMMIKTNSSFGIAYIPNGIPYGIVYIARPAYPILTLTLFLSRVEKHHDDPLNRYTSTGSIDSTIPSPLSRMLRQVLLKTCWLRKELIVWPPRWKGHSLEHVQSIPWVGHQGSHRIYLHSSFRMPQSWMGLRSDLDISLVYTRVSTYYEIIVKLERNHIWPFRTEASSRKRGCSLLRVCNVGSLFWSLLLHWHISQYSFTQVISCRIILLNKLILTNVEIASVIIHSQLGNRELIIWANNIRKPQNTEQEDKVL